MPRRKPQLELFKSGPLCYGGNLRNTRAGRVGPRPLSTKNSVHLILRSSKAKEEWSFSKKHHRQKTEQIIKKFAALYHIKVFTIANAGNHFHLRIGISRFNFYKAFIRAVTSAIAMAVTGFSRWKKAPADFQFWDHRPYTRVVIGYKAARGLDRYIEINQLEGLGLGLTREEARAKVEWWHQNFGTG